MNNDTGGKNEVIIKADHKALHALTDHWKSDLGFYKDELQFLDTLIDKYIGLMITDEHRERIRKMTISFSEIEKYSHELDEKVTEHAKNLTHLLQNPFSHEENLIMSEHRQLEDFMAAFVKSFREVKREIFSITAHVLREQKLRKYSKHQK